MLVRIVAIGLTHALWKNLFHHLRTLLPGEHFSAGFFSSPEEIGYLEAEYFPYQWAREPPDLILADAGGAPELEQRLAFLRRVQELGPAPAPVLGLTLRTFPHGLRQLVQGRLPVTLHLDNEAQFSLSDPGLLIDSFPEDFPRLRVNEHMTALRLPHKKGRAKEVRPNGLPMGTLLGFSQIESIVHAGEALPPRQWLKGVTRQARVRLPADLPTSLYRERGGLYLFPGVPLNRVRSVTVGGVTFGMLIDLGSLNPTSPGFAALAGSVEEAGRHRAEALRALDVRLREAEDRTDLPICCIGGTAPVNRLMTALLTARGYRRVTAGSIEALPTFEEPTLLFRLTGDGPQPPPQAEEPLMLAIEGDLAPDLALLDELLPWRELEPAPEVERIGRAAFTEARRKLAARTGKAREGQGFTERRNLLLSQEIAVRQRALEILERCLAPPVRLWEGEAPERATELLVLSFDAEEAQAVFRAAPGIPKRRWFDLAPLADADSAQNVDLANLQSYAVKGAVVVTPAARKRMEAIRTELRGGLEASRQSEEDTRAAAQQYGDSLERQEDTARELAQRWMREVQEGWLDAHESRLLTALAALRPRNEHGWFNRGQVNRIALLCGDGENRKSLQQACGAVYPHFNPELSAIVPYGFEPLDRLSAEERESVTAAAKAESLPRAEIEARLAQALERENARLLEAYLEIAAAAVTELPRVDLLLIDQRPEVAVRLLEHLRESAPALAQVPAVLMLPDSWSPPEGGSLPWPRTRVVITRRMGALDAETAAKQLRALYAL